ncbi:MAG TPA: 2-amino-4-hydroxy-6-hydroxymethyldihydropteridine diphosphokinase [Acidothermaceae bacterium]|nr:2-amino-4-hydroxy-6-hydroxymethyldihydropteridine diphosphokinase [Acidothermaceae bacterium]
MKAVLALGTNLGDRAATLQTALDGLVAQTEVVAVSAIYETAPVGGPPQPDFYNAVVLVDTSLTATDLLSVAHSLEAAAGRVRFEHWGPRTLDVDLLAYGDARSDDLDLTLPHPRAHERAFVVVPWLEIEPDGAVDGHGTLAELAAELGTDGVRRLDTPTLSISGVVT